MLVTHSRETDNSNMAKEHVDVSRWQAAGDTVGNPTHALA